MSAHQGAHGVVQGNQEQDAGKAAPSHCCCIALHVKGNGKVLQILLNIRKQKQKNLLVSREAADLGRIDHDPREHGDKASAQRQNKKRYLIPAQPYDNQCYRAN